MGQRPLLLALVLVLSACTPDTTISGPRLLQEATLAPASPEATRILSPTPIPTPLAIPVSTSELEAPLQVATINVDFVLVTPTLPPSKTPTPTSTQTATITQPPSLTPTPTMTATTIFVPTAVAALVTPIPANPQPLQPQSCSGQWFFTQPRPAACPAGPSFSSPAAMLQFQQGFMVWIGEQDAIYVLYDSANTPRWQVFHDTFEEGMLEFDPDWGEGPPYTWQPRRGFGKVWRERADVRQRIGWAVREWSEPYTAQVQTATDGSFFIQESRGGVFNLLPNGSDWKRYEGYSSF